MLSAQLLESIPQSIRIIRKFSTQSLCGSLTLQQFRVLRLVLEGHGQTQMAEILDVSLAAVSKMITALMAQKLITRRPGPDKRTHLIRLTPKGKLTYEKLRFSVQQKLDVGVESLSQSEKVQLLDGLLVLDKLMKNLKEV